MSKQVITLSDRAAERVKEIIASAKEPIIGVRVGVASGGCAGMSYVMEYAKNANKKGIQISLLPERNSKKMVNGASNKIKCAR